MWLNLADVGSSHKQKNECINAKSILKRENTGLVVLRSPWFLMTILLTHSKKKEINTVRKSPIGTRIVCINNKEDRIVFFAWPQETEGLISAFTCLALFPQGGECCVPNPREHLHACLIWSLRLQCLLWHTGLKRGTGNTFWWKAECSADDKVTSSQHQ